jgi:hypothetical protein
VTPRYAIYYAPSPQDALTNDAARWLGRDAFGRPVEPRELCPQLADLDLDALTKDPRHYGFHATLKAPFELAENTSESGLLEAFNLFAESQSEFEARLIIAELGPFIALKLAETPGEMDALHRDCVEAFETFRAPLSPQDIARRRRARLTPTQDERLVSFGYPYIFEDFRFHMTLTGSIAEIGVRSRILAHLKERYALWEGVHAFNCISLFKQEAREAPFFVFAQRSFGPAQS